MTPFDYIKSFSNKSKNLMKEEDIDGKNYPPFIINRGLSFMQDTIHFANIMNRFSALDKQQQHDFYFYGIPKGRRNGQWIKKEEISADVQIVSDYFCINTRTAAKYIELLTSDELQIIRDKMNQGGKNAK